MMGARLFTLESCDSTKSQSLRVRRTMKAAPAPHAASEDGTLGSPHVARIRTAAD